MAHITHAASTKERAANASLAIDEEKVLRCLGAAVIMQWRTLPTPLQRELFDRAGSIDELADAFPLRREIARFLHRRKEERP